MFYCLLIFQNSCFSSFEFKNLIGINEKTVENCKKNPEFPVHDLEFISNTVFQ